jgi:hypothetical protein
VTSLELLHDSARRSRNRDFRRMVGGMNELAGDETKPMLSIVGDEGVAVSAEHGRSISGDGGTSITDESGYARSGRRGISVVGHRGTSVTGDGGIAAAGIGGLVKAGVDGMLIIIGQDPDGVRFAVTADIDTVAGPLPDTFHRLRGQTLVAVSGLTVSDDGGDPDEEDELLVGGGAA